MITLEEQAFLHQHLERSEREMMSAVSAASAPEDFWQWRAGEEEWSAAQCAKHAAIVETSISSLLDKLATLPEESFDPEVCQATDRRVLQVESRGERAKAPDRVNPTRIVPSIGEFVMQFKESRERLNSAIARNSQTARGRFLEHPFFKRLDGYQWALIASCHTIRHVAQMREIRSEFDRRGQ